MTHARVEPLLIEWLIRSGLAFFPPLSLILWKRQKRYLQLEIYFLEGNTCKITRTLSGREHRHIRTTMQDFVGSVASSGPPQKKRRLSTTASGSTERSEDSPVTPSTDNSPNSSVLHKVCTPSPDGQAPSSTTTRQSSLLQHKQSTATRVPRWIDALLADWEEAIAGTLETGRGDFLQSLPVLPKVADAIRKRSCEALVLRPQNSLAASNRGV